MRLRLGARLEAVADMASGGRIVADIGTDHALVPIKLIKDCGVQKVYASDIRTGPLERAVRNIRRFSLEEKIETFIYDGIDDSRLLDCDTIVIAGMGAESIASIIEKSCLCRNANVNLVLQPMSAVGFLRDFLYKSGFEILNEILCREENKIYNIIKAGAGLDEDYLPIHGIIGKKLIENGGSVLEEYLNNEIKKREIAIDEMKKSATARISKEYSDMLRELSILQELKGGGAYNG